MEVTAPHRARAAEQPPKRRTRPPGARSFRISDSAWLLGLGFVRLTRVTRGLLRGVRGRPGIDADKVIAAIVRLGALMDDDATILEVDCNPVISAPAGTTLYYVCS